MNTTTEHPSVNDVRPTLTRKDLLTSIALRIEGHGMRNLGGIERIEYMEDGHIAELPIVDTVFELIADEARQLGKEVDNTVGGVMENVFGFERGSALAAEYAHEIGCYCHGDFISPIMAAGRVRNLIDFIS